MLELRTTNDCIKNNCERKILEYAEKLKLSEKQVQILENQLKSIAKGESSSLLFDFNKPVFV